MPDKKPTNTFRILLLKEGLIPEQALEEPETLQKKNLVGVDGVFYYRAPFPYNVYWFPFFEDRLDPPLDITQIKGGAAGVMFIPVDLEGEERYLMYTWGRTRAIIKAESYESYFGLKVVLNTVEDKLKSLDVKTIEETSLQKVHQVSKQASLEAFGIDVARDLLRGATGIPKEKEFAKRVTGSDPLVITSKTEFEELGEKSLQILTHWKSDRYKENPKWKWVDLLRIVRDKKKKKDLDDELISDLNNGNLDRIHMAPPELIDWEDIRAFKYFSRKRVYPELNIEECYSELDKEKHLNLNYLKGKRIEVIRGDYDRSEPEWPIYRCLIYETRQDEQVYILNDREWFRVNQGLVEETDNYIKNYLPKTELNLPKANFSEGNDKDEGAYNIRVSNEVSGILTMDRKLTRIYGQIEFCDLLTIDKKIIHVKRKGGVSMLSHLFAQASKPAGLFYREEDFRKDAKRVIAGLEGGSDYKELIPIERRPNPGEFEVVFAIISKPVDENKDWRLELPFFSRFNLKQHAQEIAGYEYKVSTLHIEQEETVNEQDEEASN